MDEQKQKEDDFMDFKGPFFDELDKIKQAATEEVGNVQEVPIPPPVEHAPSGVGEAHPELRVLLERIVRNASHALSLLPQSVQLGIPSAVSGTKEFLLPVSIGAPGVVIEGTFDGTGMIGSDGKQYSMPANYASKSKLVEGDLLKLTITPEGSFVYKQTHPIERYRVVGPLVHDATARQYSVSADGKFWKVLTASVSYYKGVPGDEVVILVPKEGTSSWGAVEHIIKKI